MIAFSREYVSRVIKGKIMNFLLIATVNFHNMHNYIQYINLKMSLYALTLETSFEALNSYESSTWMQIYRENINFVIRQ